MGNGSSSVEARPGTHGVPETATKGRSLPTSASPSVASAAVSSAMACARASGLLKSLAKARWITPSACAGSGAQDVQVGEGTAERGAAGGLDGLRGRVGAGQCQDGVAVGEELGDDGRADQAGAAGDEDSHRTLLK